MRFLLFLNFLFSVCFLSACMSRRSAEVIEALEPCRAEPLGIGTCT